MAFKKKTELWGRNSRPKESINETLEHLACSKLPHPPQILALRKMNPPLEVTRPFATPSDFYRLGLKRGECSSVAIRDATESAVQRLTNTTTVHSLELFDRELGQLATSAYRLLDPRYRRQFYERIQLSYAVARDDFVVPTFQEDALLTAPTTPCIVTSESDYCNAANSRSDLNVPGDSLETGKSLERAREVVRWIRHSEENSRQFRPKWTKRFLVSLKAWLDNRMH